MIEYRMTKDLSPCLRGQNCNENWTKVKRMVSFLNTGYILFLSLWQRSKSPLGIDALAVTVTNIKHGQFWGDTLYNVHLSHAEDWQKSDNQNSMFTHHKTFTVYEMHTFDMSINEPACPWIAAPWHNPVFADLDLISLYFRSRSIHNER